MKPNGSLISGVLLGAVAGAVLMAGFFSWQARLPKSELATDTKAEKPLYWVAPMDANYRRDQPGQSPMGMDLVPVYAQGGSSASPGSVEVSPEVVNSLGVRSAAATRGDWQNAIRTVGYVSYDEDRMVHIHPRVSGWVESLYVKTVGDPVTQGQALYKLYSPELVSAQEELLLALKRNNPSLIDAATARLQALQLSSEFIDALRRRGSAVQTVTFHAIQSGVVDQLPIREGFYVQPGTTMMSIGQLDEVWVEAEVFERQAANLKAGLAVTMRLDYLPGRTWQGRVDYVYPSLDPKLRTARLRLRFDNADGALKPNMFAQVVIHTAPAQNVLAVPREAVIRTGTQDRVVLSLGDGRFKSIAVRLGRSNETAMEILSGLQEGDQVVTSAQFLLDSESSKSSDFQRMQMPKDSTYSSPTGMSGMSHEPLSHGSQQHD